MDNSKLLKVFGSDELVKMFNEMDRDAQTRILTSSFKKAAKLIISEAQGNLGGSFKHISSSLGMSMKKDTQTLMVGAIKKKGGHLAHIINSGTKERAYKTKNNKMHRTGRIIANNFWSSAMKRTESGVEETIYKDIKDRFNKLIQKMSIKK